MFRLLTVTAHPDDEAGAFGGTLATYADQSVETAVICLTPGQAASHRGIARDEQHLATLRREEFAHSCRLLRVKRAEVLDYRDGSLVLENFHRMVGDIVRRIREFRPHVVIALGTEGLITAHPDHTMASLVGACAFHWAAHSTQYTDQLHEGLKPHRTQKLYFTTSTFHLPGREPTSLAPITASIDIGRHLETKIAAFKCHTTQGPLFPLLEQNMRKRGAVEVFHLAACVEIGPAREETDLFEGVKKHE